MPSMLQKFQTFKAGSCESEDYEMLFKFSKGVTFNVMRKSFSRLRLGALMLGRTPIKGMPTSERKLSPGSRLQISMRTLEPN
jgi:hypothetical protein